MVDEVDRISTACFTLNIRQGELADIGLELHRANAAAFGSFSLRRDLWQIDARAPIRVTASLKWGATRTCAGVHAFNLRCVGTAIGI